ncbi:hypothetical protein RUM43_014681, partial [Polyplax serrata]
MEFLPYPLNFAYQHLMLVTNTSTSHQFNFEDLSVQRDEAVVTTFKARVPVEPH